MQKQKTKSKFLFTLTILTITGFITIGYLGTAEAYPMPEPPKHVEAIEGNSEKFCDLDAVICPNEEIGVIREVSAYNSLEAQTDASPCIGADGTDLCQRYQKGECIVASNAYPLGTKIEIDKIGKCTVADRMNKRYSNRIDLFMDKDIERALKFGVQKLSVISL